jgi:hypothetical protein
LIEDDILLDKKKWQVGPLRPSFSGFGLGIDFEDFLFKPYKEIP